MASGLALIVHDDPAEVVEPSKSAFHDPALGHRYETAPGRWGTTGYVMLPAQGLYLPHKKALIRLVRQHATQATGPSRSKLTSVGQQGLCAAAAVAIGRVHHDAPEAPTRVAEYLALAPIYALVRIKAPLLAQTWG